MQLTRIAPTYEERLQWTCPVGELRSIIGPKAFRRLSVEIADCIELAACCSDVLPGVRIGDMRITIIQYAVKQAYWIEV